MRGTQLKQVQTSQGIRVPQSEITRVARYAAGSVMYGWGEVNHQYKMPGRNIWWFSCAGHGGYVVVTTPWDDNPFIPEGFKPTIEWNNGIKLYQFEEDCDWAVLEYYNPAVSEWSKQYVCGSTMTAARHEFYIMQSVALYRPELMKPEDVQWAKELYLSNAYVSNFRLMNESIRSGMFNYYANDLKDMKSRMDRLPVGIELKSA